MNIIPKPTPYGFNRSALPDMVIVHAMGEYIDLYDDPKPDPHAEEFLRMMKLSAHALICPNGDVMECRKDFEGAYHAKGFNATSLGVEFLVEGTHTYGTFADKIKTHWLTDAQHDSGVELVRRWVGEYEIPIDRVLRHSDVSPGRKIDPGSGFNFPAFKEECFA